MEEDNLAIMEAEAEAEASRPTCTLAQEEEGSSTSTCKMLMIYSKSSLEVGIHLLTSSMMTRTTFSAMDSEVWVA